jgi:hypothetical protein
LTLRLKSAFRDLEPSRTALSQLSIAFRKNDNFEEIKKTYYGAGIPWVFDLGKFRNDLAGLIINSFL